MNRLTRFLRAVALVAAVGIGSAGAVQAATYAFWPNWLWDTVNTTVLSYTGTLFTFGQAAGVPAHVASAQTTAPALTSCGTSPAISGTDMTGTVTMGTTATGCVITFNVAYATAPHCTVTWRATPLASQSYTVSATALTLTQTSTSNNLADYTCVAPAGG